jgi:transposase
VDSCLPVRSAHAGGRSRTVFLPTRGCITSNVVASQRRETGCELYRLRWQVELFFKWIKQQQRIICFFGTSENAVKTQVWIAVSVYVLVAIIRKPLALEMSLHSMLQTLRS